MKMLETALKILAMKAMVAKGKIVMKAMKLLEAAMKGLAMKLLKAALKVLAMKAMKAKGQCRQ